MRASHLSTAAPGTRRRPWGGWVFLGFILAIAAALAITINLLWERADECRRVQTELAFLEADAHELDAAQWEMMAGKKLDEELFQEMEKIQAQMHERVSHLGRLELNLPKLEEFNKKYQVYVRLVDQEFKLLAAGKINEAEQFDVATEDPAFDAMHGALEEAGAAYAKITTHTLDLVRAGIFLILLGGVGVIAGLVWQFNKKRCLMEVAAAEQRVLNQAKENLELRVQERTAELSALNLQMERRIAGRTTELAKSNAEMDEVVKLYHSLADQLPANVYRKNAKGLFIFVNSRFCRSKGRTADEILGQTVYAVNSKEEAEQVAKEHEWIMRTGQVIEKEESYLQPDGTVEYLQAIKSPVFAADGKIIGTQGIQFDITRRKQLEAQLVQSQKMEIVGKLAGGVAHEFNSILTGIIIQSELLLEYLPATSPLAENAAEIRKAADRAASLTRQLLAYGRKQILQPEILDLNAVLAGMENTLRHLLGRGVEMHLAPAAGLKAVKADAGQIEQVIMNLAMNADDAMPKGGKLALETANVSFGPESVDRHPELKPGGYVMLAVTDTGTGMSEEVKTHVFEPFFTTKDVGQGTGLGLSTCYGIIKQSGGHISVQSEPGRGTTFKIYLPQVEPQAKIPVRRLDSPDLPRGTETILLVEDDPAMRNMAATLLKRLGYTVLAAAGGIEALKLKQERSGEPIDLLFTNVVMPHMSGQELSDRVRTLNPHIKVLFTSACTENAIARQVGLNNGVVLLQKPFTPSALAHKLREVLDK